MAHFSPAHQGGRFVGGSTKHQVVGGSEDSFSDEDELQHDGIRRSNYLAHHQAAGSTSSSSAPTGAAAIAAASSSLGSASQQQQQDPTTIHVTLNESYFANEKRALVNLLANCRQKLNSLQMFNPAKNQSMREQQEQQWNENEKYMLGSINEIKSGLDEQFQWTRPQDKREVWGSKLQYFFTITSYSIGLGNVIRFPILVQKNGGLAFIIPFVIMLVVEGIPLFYLELAVGQRMRKAAISCWNLVSPFAAGIGLASAGVSFIIGLYYNTMVAWTLLYLWGSVWSRPPTPLPFTQCPSHTTADSLLQDGSSSINSTAANNLLNNSNNHNHNTSVDSVQLLSPMTTNYSEEDECQIIGPFQHYWYRQTLDISDNVNSWNNFNWPVFFALCFAWLISHLCLFRGLSSSKRIVYITFTLPYVILTIFFFKATSLKGISDGIYYLFEPEWSKLVDPYVWLQAAAQVFFSLGLGFGGLIALSSYNPVNNNCYKDAIKVSLINFSTSIYAGIVIFAILGYKANLSYDKCALEREQKINYYLSDYYLKVLDYGSVFEDNSTNLALETNPITSRSDISSPINSTGQEKEEDGNDYYDSADALASIKSLDRQLDENVDPSELNAGDKDIEFEIDLRRLISPEQLEQIINRIPGLEECSVRKELEGSSNGTGLVFVVMAEAISEFGSNAACWASAFFFMLLMLGLDSQFGNLEGLLSSVADLSFAASSIGRQWITGFICVTSLAFSVIMFAHGAGSYMFAIFDEYAASFSLVIIAIFELIAVSFIYGLKRFCDDCELMTGKRPPFLVLLSWRYISPILLLVVTLACLREFSVSLTYQAWSSTEHEMETKPWPAWCISFGLLLIASCVVWIPAVAILRYLKINIIPEESLSQCWFPAEELREFHDLQEEHKVTKLERVLFGFRSDDD